MDSRQPLSVEVSVELQEKESTVIVFASMCDSLSRCLSPEQPRWADDDGEQEDQPAGPGRVPEEERNGTAWKLPPQDTQPDAHMGATGGNTHTHICMWQVLQMEDTELIVKVLQLDKSV